MQWCTIAGWLRRRQRTGCRSEEPVPPGYPTGRTLTRNGLPIITYPGSKTAPKKTSGAPGVDDIQRIGDAYFEAGGRHYLESLGFHAPQKNRGTEEDLLNDDAAG